MKYLIVLLIALSLMIAGCAEDDPAQPDDIISIRGFTSLGNSLTAGYMDSGLHMPGQLNSFPRLIAGQMGIDTAPDGSDFTQPYVDFPGLGSSDPDTPGFMAGVLYFDGTTVDLLGETPLSETPDKLLAVADPEPYNNLAVPGAFLLDIMHAFDIASSFGVTIGQPNPFFSFINRVPLIFSNTSVDGPPSYESASMFGQALDQGAGLVTLWIGNNDVLGGASGGSPIIGENITDPEVFSTQYQALLNALAHGLMERNGEPSTIIVGNIPNITDIPYFIPKLQFEEFMEGDWAGGYNEGNTDDGLLVTLPAISHVQDHPDDPLPGNFTLTSTEVATVADVVAFYNTTISNAVEAINDAYPGTCALMNANELMANLPDQRKTHFLFSLNDPANHGSIPLAAASTYFSLDGTHPNQKGYGMLANAFLTEINALMGTSYPGINLDDLIWDPTYGQQISSRARVEGAPRISSRAASALKNMH